MKTVKQLKEELAKFPDEALCFAYSGEVEGVTILKNRDIGEYGFIYCSEYLELNDEQETDLFKEESN